MNEIYLDFQATTPTDPQVVDAMARWWSTPANPHATENAAGRRAAVAVEEARGHAARLIGADPSEIYFTSGSTEAANIAIRSAGTGPGSPSQRSSTPACARRSPTWRPWGRRRSR